MLELIIEILSYDRERNEYQARTSTGVLFTFDPLVGCALLLSDKEYDNGDGEKFVGNKYAMTEYSVSNDVVTPHEKGLILIKGMK